MYNKERTEDDARKRAKRERERRDSVANAYAFAHEVPACRVPSAPIHNWRNGGKSMQFSLTSERVEKTIKLAHLIES